MYLLYLVIALSLAWFVIFGWFYIGCRWGLKGWVCSGLLYLYLIATMVSVPSKMRSPDENLRLLFTWWM